MRSLFIFTILAASALAGDNNNYNGQPMDYFDDDFQSNLKVGPESTFTYNFEHARRDQPPHVEMREENVGRYIQARPETTPVSIFSMKADRESQHVYPKMISNNNYHQQDHWNGPQVSSVPPPPKFAFSRQNNQPIQKSSAPAWNAPAAPHHQPIQKNSAPAWNTPAVPQDTHPSNSYNNYPHHVPAAPSSAPHHAQWMSPHKPQTTASPNSGIHFAPSASYVSDSISNNNAPHQPPTLPGRGSHKFSWDDVKSTHEHKENAPIMYNPQPVATSTPQPIHNKPVPPVPTLSPWYDGFGK